MEQIELVAEKREVLGKKVKRIREAGLVPAIIYGPEIAPIPVQVDEHELATTLRQAGANRLVAIQLGDDGQSHVTLVRDVQRDVITRSLLHVDFQQVVLTETITSEVPVILEGTPSIVRQGAAIVNQTLNAVEIEALPTDLIPSITIDISDLEEVDDAVFVRDLDLPDRITILTDPDEIIVRLGHPELELEEIEEEIPEAEVEVEVVPEGVEPEELEEIEAEAEEVEIE